jgi:exopolysaccharide production protein ExoZ
VKIQSLQAGRGIAASAVILHHSAIAAHNFGQAAPGYAILSRGYIGVDFFFVLSGFIIFHSTVGRGKSLRDYAGARFRRIYLPYWPIGLAVALAYVAMPHLSASNRGWSWLPTLTLLPVDSAPALSVAWTLKHEMLFYILFGLFYFSRLLPLGLIAWGLGIAILPHVMFQAINVEFFMGMLAAILYRHKQASPVLLIFAALAFLLWIYVGASDETSILAGLGFMFLIAPIAQMERRELFKVPGWLVFLGAASYSLYLVHTPLISVVARFSPAILMTGVAVSFAGGIAYHLWVERPLLMLLKGGHSPAFTMRKPTISPMPPSP